MNQKNLENGFSLLELLVAVAILAVGLISIQSLENQNIDASNYINDTSIAMMLADYKLGEESIRATFGDVNSPLKSFSDEFPSFKIEATSENELTLPIELPINLPPVLLVNVTWKFHNNTENLLLMDYLPNLQNIMLTPQTTH